MNKINTCLKCNSINRFFLFILIQSESQKLNKNFTMICTGYLIKLVSIKIINWLLEIQPKFHFQSFNALSLHVDVREYNAYVYWLQTYNCKCFCYCEHDATCVTHSHRCVSLHSCIIEWFSPVNLYCNIQHMPSSATVCMKRSEWRVYLRDHMQFAIAYYHPIYSTCDVFTKIYMTTWNVRNLHTESKAW